MLEREIVKEVWEESNLYGEYLLCAWDILLDCCGATNIRLYNTIIGASWLGGQILSLVPNEMLVPSFFDFHGGRGESQRYDDCIVCNNDNFLL